LRVLGARLGANRDLATKDGICWGLEVSIVGVEQRLTCSRGTISASVMELA
jgi:hypothetical protein